VKVIGPTRSWRSAGHWYSGMYVALCNHTKTHNVRCKSFVTDAHGKKVHVQLDSEPVYLTVP
jgi:hypothetical protein